MNMIKDTLVKPFLRNEKLSFLLMISSPMKLRIMAFLAKATGTMAAALIPRSPSESQSTLSPVANAINMQSDVETDVGMHITIAGSIDSITYGPNWAKLHNTICPSIRMM